MLLFVCARYDLREHFSSQGPELLSKYVGESERAVREVRTLQTSVHVEKGVFMESDVTTR